ncbi:hypothetical protein FNT36_03315 [Hymenobacter setariae]|uniref:Uncharacterized protein n=1 Tax=Hymenobacter setariae TaxID=2594794 RepID=A0A558C335_9BACT|nr:hypothetical protein [Hymenobacter setariae]TVT43136.1 hypothetical protein FNT36_03315 [Hymenobacter setariae]
MKKLLFIGTLGILVTCKPERLAYPVAVTAHAQIWTADSKRPQAIVEAGDTVDLVMPVTPEWGQIAIRLSETRIGYVSIKALAWPDSLKAKAGVYAIGKVRK